MKPLERIWKKIYISGKFILWFFYHMFWGSWRLTGESKEYERKQRIKEDKELEKNYRTLRNIKIRDM